MKANSSNFKSDKTRRLIVSSVTGFFCILTLGWLTACRATTKTKFITDSLADMRGTTLYLEGYGPDPLPSTAAAYPTVDKGKLGTLNQMKASFKETEIPLEPGHGNGGLVAGQKATKSGNEKRRTSSPDTNSDDYPLPTQSYEGRNRQELAWDDDLKTIRQARMVWTVAGAAKGAAIGAILRGGLAALSGGDSNAIRNAAISGGIAGGFAGAVEGRAQGGRKGAETVEKKHQARRTEAEIADAISGAQKFNEAVAKFNAKLRIRVGSQSSKSELRNFKKDAGKVVDQIDRQIKGINDFLSDDTAQSAHDLMYKKLLTLNQLKASINETEKVMGSGRA